jgi:phosphatidylcholine synthase
VLDGAKQNATAAKIHRERAAVDWAKLASLGVHLYTALGAVLGLASLLFAADYRVRPAFIALALATVIDSTDGFAARALSVARRLPDFDGALLDNVVDYLTYVAAPAFLMLRMKLLPTSAGGLATAALLMLASAYGFCRREAKTADHYFLGFPSYWNVTALYMFCFKTGTTANAIAVVVLALMVFLPLKFIYPSRTTELRRLTLALGLAWTLLIFLLLVELPSPSPVLVFGSFSFVIYYFAASFALQARSLMARNRIAASVAP